MLTPRSEIERKRDGILEITIRLNSREEEEEEEEERQRKHVPSRVKAAVGLFNFGRTRFEGITLLLLTLLGRVLGLGGNPVARCYISDHPDNRFAEGKLRGIFVSRSCRCDAAGKFKESNQVVVAGTSVSYRFVRNI